MIAWMCGVTLVDRFKCNELRKRVEIRNIINSVFIVSIL